MLLVQKPNDDWLLFSIWNQHEIDNFNKLFGFKHYNTKSTTVLLNCFLLNTRYVIYRHKYDGFKPTLASYIQTIKNDQRTEYNISKRNRKMNQHFLKWSHCMWNVIVDWLLLIFFYSIVF